MKKLMIAVVAVAMATCAQAAKYQWKIGTTALTQDGGSALTAQVKVYCFATQNLTQDKLIEMFATTHAIDETRAISSTMTVSSKVSANTTAVTSIGKDDKGSPIADPTSINTYFAYIVGDEMFVSAANADLAVKADPNTTSWSFGSFSKYMQNKSGDYSYKTAGGFQGAGWYSAVPEPTSAMLLLLGVAGLALKRRRA